MKALSREVTYEGDTSNDGGILELGEVGGSLIVTNDGSRWEAYDSRASASSAQFVSY